jgi:hypothetical protein
MALCSLLLGACFGSDAAGSTSGPEPAKGTPVETGITVVDEFLNLIAADKLETIAEGAAFESIVCEGGTTYIADAPMLPCSGSGVAGTIADAIIKGCSPHTAIRQQDLRQEIDWLAGDWLTLEAVYELEVIEPSWHLDPATQKPKLEYGLQFSNGSQAPGNAQTVVYLTSAGALKALDDCDEDITSSNATQVWQR